ncbi:uncharacterized protein I303_101097 [Kwoniella dejecticola CBS 10117]|uniref:Uncharacterized protein n=1 Tax=Kwoniella dejecticola CBS 10117 TaxID=1296121 RepID=A0A1A6AGT5_9TREE|nr:uncharacterized protein I303_01101 [Kwoniella dejecticola CBS 10117]OBR89276.1 hypothetical protein I303_01101 [Kwoniella dejecticola CBS 10117]
MIHFWLFAFLALLLAATSPCSALEQERSPLTAHSRDARSPADLEDRASGDCSMVTRDYNLGRCDANACRYNNRADFSQGRCERNGATGRCRGFNLGPRAPRFACRFCTCRSDKDRFAKVNGKNKLRKDTGKLASYISRVGTRNTDATLNQFLTWHGGWDVANPISDWVIKAETGYLSQYGVYRRQSENSSTIYNVGKTELEGGKHKFTLLHPVSLNTNNAPPSSAITERDTNSTAFSSRELILNNAAMETDEEGLVSSSSVEIISREVGKRADWSSMNFQYWSASGNRYFDGGRDDMVIMVYDLLWRAEPEDRGYCVTLLDDEMYWGTIKIWTGVDGNGLGDCECSRSTYWGLRTDHCNYWNWQDYPGTPDRVW